MWGWLLLGILVAGAGSSSSDRTKGQKPRPKATPPPPPQPTRLRTLLIALGEVVRECVNSQGISTCYGALVQASADIQALPDTDRRRIEQAIATLVGYSDQERRVRNLLRVVRRDPGYAARSRSIARHLAAVGIAREHLSNSLREIAVQLVLSRTSTLSLKPGVDALTRRLEESSDASTAALELELLDD